MDAIRPRDRVHAWLREPLSEQNRSFRLTALSQAFGLTEHYLRSRYFPQQGSPPNGMGHLLEAEIISWIDLHPNLELNNPQYIETDWNELSGE